jgi:hypothetical protein
LEKPLGEWDVKDFIRLANEPDLFDSTADAVEHTLKAVRPTINRASRYAGAAPKRPIKKMTQDELDEYRESLSRAWNEHGKQEHLAVLVERQWVGDVLRAIADAPRRGDSPFLAEAIELPQFPEHRRRIVFDADNNNHLEHVSPSVGPLREKFEKVLENEKGLGSRVRRCPICDCVFWARNITQSACTPQHANRAHQRKWYKENHAPKSPAKKATTRRAKNQPGPKLSEGSPVTQKTDILTDGRGRRSEWQ